MSKTTQSNEILLARLAEGLDSTAQLTQALLSDLKESEGDFAVIKSELSTLKKNVQSLSDLLKDGGTSSLLTKIALIEQNVANIKTIVDDYQALKIDSVDIKKQIKDIESRLSLIETTIKEIKNNKEKDKMNPDLLPGIIIVFILVVLGWFALG